MCRQAPPSGTSGTGMRREKEARRIRTSAFYEKDRISVLEMWSCNK